MTKLILCIFALSFTLGLASNGILVGQWNYKGTVYDQSECDYFCCCPQGIINVAADSSNSSQVLVSATKWSNNAFCQALGLGSLTSQLRLPYSSAATFDDVNSLSTNYIFQDGDNELVYYVAGIAQVPVTGGVNTTQLNITMDQEMLYAPSGESGATCTIILNKFVVADQIDA